MLCPVRTPMGPTPVPMCDSLGELCPCIELYGARSYGCPLMVDVFWSA